MTGNAVNTVLSHQSSMGDDNIFVKTKIESYTFLTFGTVKKYEEGRVDVTCGRVTFYGVEVMVLGVNGWGIKPVPAEGDRVLLLTSQAPVPDLKEFEAPGSMPAYDVSGMKAIPITDDEKATQLITVSADGIEITGDNKLTVNSDGVTLEDVNGNKVITDSAGVTVTDLSKNTFVMKEEEISMAVKEGSTIVATKSSVKINDALEIKKS
jgi:hypothetical protein